MSFHPNVRSPTGQSNSHSMKTRHLVAGSLLLASCLFAAGSGVLIFEDDFERNESQEKKDEVGKGWETNSRSRAKGNKQVDLGDGTMRVYIHKEANHGVSVRHDAVFRDGSVGLRFKLENPKDSLGLDFADLGFKEVHAGHLFKVTVTARNVQIDDMKSGGMNLKFHEAKKAKTLSSEQKKFLASTKKVVPLKLEVGQWHDLKVDIEGDTVSAAVDGKQVAAFSSPGFAHPTKKMLRLAVPRQAVLDDLKIWRLK